MDEVELTRYSAAILCLATMPDLAHFLKAFQQQQQQQQQQPMKRYGFTMPAGKQQQFGDNKRWKKRSAALEQPTEEDIAEFNRELAELKEAYMDGVSNVTCVLMTLGALDNMFMINKEYFVNDMWRDVSLKQDLKNGMDFDVVVILFVAV